jgi:DNA-binding transcriptional MerR regulator
MYTIGQISEMFDLPISTLRYYDREGLFPALKRQSGIRQFDEKDIEVLRTIECLKKSGLGITDIKQFMIWCSQGSTTYELRRQLFEKQKKTVEEEIKKMQQTLDMIKFKCWYYDEAIKDGNEDQMNPMNTAIMPKEIKAIYSRQHKKRG